MREARLLATFGPRRIAKNDRGRVSDSFAINHAQLVLRRAAIDETNLERLIDDLHDPKSANYHKWLTAAQFGERYGVADSDLNKITSWMSSHGLKTNFVSTSKMIVDFSGTASQIRDAFHIEIHHLSVNGVKHIANMGDPQIPAALAPAIIGIVSLHDFRPHTNFVPRAKFPALTGSCSGAACLAVMPADLATIYNLTPAFRSGTTGKGVSIVVIEDSDIGPLGVPSGADWTTFRNVAGLSGYSHASFEFLHPNVAAGQNCSDPGVNGDEGEATLDAEWASASAPDASIIMASCADVGVFPPASFTFGGLIAIENLINGPKPPPIISMSYGFCEAENGAASNAAFNATFQQAVTEGVTVFVSSGDESSVSCDNADETSVSRHGIGITGWGSSPYVVSVGGTDFGDTLADCKNKPFPACNGRYWKSTNSHVFGSAKSYIPEIPWNSSCAGALLSAFYTGSPAGYGATGFCNTPLGNELLTMASGSGGPSGCATGAPMIAGVVGGSCAGWAKPAYQKNMPGNPHDGVRDIPDVSLFAANGTWGHFYLFCDSIDDGCSPSDPTSWSGAGGTSFSAPIFAGIMALIEQKTGQKQGEANRVLYSLAAGEYGARGNRNCNASLGNKARSGCVFHDVTEGDMAVNCVGLNNCFAPTGRNGVVSTSVIADRPAYKASVGWDFATGLGSVNVTNLINAWPRQTP